MKIRVSYGTAIAMGLIKARMLAKPRTAYLMTYHDGRCRNNCAFCPQARGSEADLRRLSRITWPAFDVEEVVENLPAGGFARICLQTVDYPGLVSDVIELLDLFQPLGIPVSVSITPVDRGTLMEFKSRGVDYIGVGLDVASERLYPEIKESLYSWDDMWRFTEDVIDVFGDGKALVHVIVGLGETDKELIGTIERAYSTGAWVSLFAFTPIRGTRLENAEPPSLARYRRIQVAHYLIKEGLATLEDFEFDEKGSLVGFGVDADELALVIPPEIFATHGCPGCNRPYYNERPKKEPYNFPESPGKDYVRRVLQSIL
ncbi:radical SAM protein [Thermococcus thioreducens]|uniref:Biotin synthase n=1 Tax=Thermococcus thioreducens TaxID=277988 RepID=A0A1I0Q1W5_9EURY|nr:radical SAM protein [Thermococcus thioreducens]ASJ13199.1 biotin synthase [Thermococcus thioreducens]SEW20865.1 biotin synthase [Thermococcus thioreducens]